jgi:formate dehydrogenase iron-sulfur subunit
VINNVLSLATALILTNGAAAYAELGPAAPGDHAIQLAGNVARPGLYEVSFGLTLRQIVEDIGGTAPAARLALQCGGPLAPISAGAARHPTTRGSWPDGLIGHGASWCSRQDMAAQARFAFGVLRPESCGKCTPCRIGSVRDQVIDRITAGEVRRQPRPGREFARRSNLARSARWRVHKLHPVMSAIRHFPEDSRAAPGPGGGGVA